VFVVTQGRLSTESVHRLVGGAAVIGLVILAVGKWWPFNAHPQTLRAYSSPTLWQLVLSDRLTLGFVRAAIALAVVYGLVAVTGALIYGRSAASKRDVTSNGRADDTGATASSPPEGASRDVATELQRLARRDDLPV
jgi:hypothetical protein